MKEFNVLISNLKNIKYYNVLPYFINSWKEGSFDSTSVLDRDSLKEWIKKASSYRFKFKSEYEMLIAHWPLGSLAMNERIQDLINKDNFNLFDYSDNIDFYNAIMHEMHKISVYDQIMMNIDVITDILCKEFNIYTSCM